jgi:aminoglycoside phosphotransferase (APT) family kinase protein
LGDLGKPDGFVARQVSGWRKRWEIVAPENGLPAMDDAADELERTQPRSARVAILHNDLKLDNCQFDPDEPDHVRSVFDWDMATLGDPLVDLGTLLNYWPDPSDRPGDQGVYNDGMERMGLPTQAEVVNRYAERNGMDLSGIGWYQAFAVWKTAVVLQQLYDRYRRGETTDVRMATRGERVPELADRTLRLLGRGDTR